MQPVSMKLLLDYPPFDTLTLTHPPDLRSFNVKGLVVAHNQIYTYRAHSDRNHNQSTTTRADNQPTDRPPIVAIIQIERCDFDVYVVLFPEGRNEVPTTQRAVPCHPFVVAAA